MNNLFTTFEGTKYLMTVLNLGNSEYLFSFYFDNGNLFHDVSFNNGGWLLFSNINSDEKEYTPTIEHLNHFAKTYYKENNLQ